MTTTNQLGTIRTREDAQRFLLAMEAQQLFERGAHLSQDALGDEQHGRTALRCIAQKELRERAQPTLRVRGGLR